MLAPLPAADLQHILEHTRELWPEFRDRLVFLTGGTGFLGTWLVESFLFANDQLGLNAHLAVLTRNPPAFQRKAPHLADHAGLELFAGDVRDFIVPPREWSHVIHAATTSSAPVPPDEMFETIVAGTRRVLEFAHSHGVKRFLLTSSGSVYGRQPPELSHVPESYPGAPDPMNPNAAYGEGKRSAELLCAIAHQRHGIETTVARGFAFIGPHLPLDAHFAIGNFMRDALAGRPLQIKGDGTPLRSYLHAADLAIWLWTILVRGQPGRAYNVGSPEAVNIAMTAEAVVRASGTNVPVEIAQKPDLARAAERYVPDITRAQTELGLRAFIPLEDAIRRTLAWHRGTI